MKRVMTPMIVLLLLTSAGWLFAQDLPEPRKGDTVGWHEVREGETLSGITERYLGDSSLWPENHRLNPGIADPDRLTPGQRIRVILSREIAARRADVEQVSRRVERKPRADDWTNAHAGDQLVEREGLRTYPKSSAELGFDDGSNLVLTENSIVFLREYTSTLKRVDRSLIEVVDGGVDVAVTPKGSNRRGNDIEIVLGEVVAKPRAAGGTAKARAVKDDTSDSAKLMVYAGASEVESGGVKVNVAKGQGTSVKQGEAPAPPERLLGAPKLLAPATGETVSDELTASWAPVAKAASYIVEVCRDADCKQLVDRKVGVTTTSVTTDALPGGPLFWRVTARSASGLDGYPSATSSMSVARRVAGRVLVDRPGTGESTNMTPAAGALIRVYKDDGDGMPGAGDPMLQEVRTGEAGAWSLAGVENGTYWLTVDSRTASPEGTWLEQTAGPAGSLCADGNGGVTTIAKSGPCFGGMTADRSDAPDTLSGAEHVAKIAVADEVALGALDFVLSPSVVTNASDVEEARQGSLRQFLANAAALGGRDAMRFVPAEPAGNDGHWWTLTLTSALPPVDDEVVIDGAAWSPTGERRDVNEGNVSDAMTVGVGDAELAVAELPELEIVAPDIERPLLSRSGTLEVRNLAIHGATGANLTSVGKLVVENCLVGADAAGKAPKTAAPIEVDVSGTGSAEISKSYVRAAGSYGILVRSSTAEANVRAADLQVANCAAGAAVRIESNASSFERVYVSPCGDTPPMLAFELKGTRSNDNQTCRLNRIASSTVVGHQTGVKLRVGAMDNVVETTVFDEVTDGVELEFVMGFWVPKGNRISRNEWRGFEEPIALSGIHGMTGVKLFEGAVSCSDGGWVVDRALDFPGHVKLSREAGEVEISATLCPNVRVDAYLEKAGKLSYLGSVESDDKGIAKGRMEIPGGVTRIGVVATDKWHTSSRMSLLELD